MNYKQIFLALILCCVFATSSVFADTTISAPCVMAEYTGMSSALIYRNYTLIGGMASMVGQGFDLSSTIYKFDVSTFAEPVESAYLQIEQVAGNMAPVSSTNPLTVSAVSLLSDAADWTSVDSSQFGTAYDAVTFTKNGIYSFDITGLVNSWIGGLDNNGLALITDASGFVSPDSVGYLRLAGIDGSSYGVPAGAAPVIVATVPEPASVTLLAISSAFVLRRRRTVKA